MTCGSVDTPHSIVAAHLIDEAGQPARAARDEILAFFAGKLAVKSPRLAAGMR
jgi:hypothetical protein